MTWNWQHPDWPHFHHDPKPLLGLEERFLIQAGMFSGILKHAGTGHHESLKIDLLVDEAINSSAIEGEMLRRESVQSSIKRHFRIGVDGAVSAPREDGMANLMVDMFRSFAAPLSGTKLFSWHKMLTLGRKDLRRGAYRTHAEPMQVISGPEHAPKVHFEAPPSPAMAKEMKAFIHWFNATAPGGHTPLPALTRSGLAHLYFVSIHPFEDGNGRIARALAEKALAQHLGHPTLLALSITLERHKKDYYSMLGKSNRSLSVTPWLTYFSQQILEAQNTSRERLEFLLSKTRMFDRLRGQLNGRQSKALDRIFKEGIDGFKGGLSAQNYISITKATRPTATRDLADLVLKGALLKSGHRKHTRYRLNIGHHG